MSAGLLHLEGFEVVRGTGGAAAFAAPEVERWVHAALARHERLYEAATRQAERLLQGRGPVPVVATPSGRWVVRRYRRGGRVAALLHDRYLRLGVPRPIREAHVSAESRKRQVPTPRVLGGAIYPDGLFYRADLITELVAGAVDLARVLFEQERGADERMDALSGVGRLIARAASVGVEHVDLNAKNVLIATSDDATRPNDAGALLLDLDRCSVLPAGARADPERMIARLGRSLRRHGERTGRPLAEREWTTLTDAARSEMRR